MKIHLKGKVAVVTGASSGIGECLAKNLAKEGVIVILLARSLDRLKEIEKELLQKGHIAEAKQIDLTSKESIKNTFDSIRRKYPKIDLLINNAAVGLFETIKDTKLNEAEEVMKTNFFGPLLCIQEVLPVMHQQKQGLIVNLSSAISKQASFYQGIYAASKSALDRLSESLRIEENTNKIQVISVYIDRTRTNFRNHVVGPKDKLVLPFRRLKEASPEKVAELIIESIKKSKVIVHTSLRSRLFSFGAGILPEVVNYLFIKQYNTTLKSKKI